MSCTVTGFKIEGKPTANQIAIQGAIFKLRAQIAFKLQDPVYQTSSLIEFRRILVDQMAYKVEQLNRESFEEFEIIRENLRGLMKYVPINSGARYYTNFDEEILTTVDLDARQIYFVYQMLDSFSVVVSRS